jgi:hypothetical protein
MMNGFERYGNAQNGWTEVCLLSEYIDDAVGIEQVEALNCSDSVTGSLKVPRT